MPMLTTREIQDEILRLKKENDVCVLVHAYQSHDIWEVADYIGDSYGLSVEAAKAPNRTIVMCGVRFMAETCKMLSPDKTVILANPTAGCPMADQYSGTDVRELRKQYPGYSVVAYINTTAETKTQCDVCVTSSAAVNIVRNMPEKDILFLPDCQLGAWVADQLQEKNIALINGGCPTHRRISALETEVMKNQHPEALLLVHPECRPEVTAQADYAGSTTGIMKYAKESDAKEFIIGTEYSIVQHLQFECPDKKFYALSTECVCQNMRMTTLMDVYHSVAGTGGEEMVMSDELIEAARKPIDRMIELGG